MMPLAAFWALYRRQKFIICQNRQLIVQNRNNMVMKFTFPSTVAAEDLFYIFYDLLAYRTDFMGKGSRVRHDGTACDAWSQCNFSPVISRTSMSSSGCIAAMSMIQPEFRWRCNTIEEVFELGIYTFQWIPLVNFGLPHQFSSMAV